MKYPVIYYNNQNAGRSSDKANELGLLLNNLLNERKEAKIQEQMHNAVGKFIETRSPEDAITALAIPGGKEVIKGLLDIEKAQADKKAAALAQQKTQYELDEKQENKLNLAIRRQEILDEQRRIAQDLSQSMRGILHLSGRDREEFSAKRDRFLELEKQLRTLGTSSEGKPFTSEEYKILSKGHPSMGVIGTGGNIWAQISEDKNRDLISALRKDGHLFGADENQIQEVVESLEDFRTPREEGKLRSLLRSAILGGGTSKLVNLLGKSSLGSGLALGSLVADGAGLVDKGLNEFNRFVGSLFGIKDFTREDFNKLSPKEKEEYLLNSLKDYKFPGEEGYGIVRNLGRLYNTIDDREQHEAFIASRKAILDNPKTTEKQKKKAEEDLADIFEFIKEGPGAKHAMRHLQGGEIVPGETITEKLFDKLFSPVRKVADIVAPPSQDDAYAEMFGLLSGSLGGAKNLSNIAKAAAVTPLAKEGMEITSEIEDPYLRFMSQGAVLGGAGKAAHSNLPSRFGKSAYKQGKRLAKSAFREAKDILSKGEKGFSEVSSSEFSSGVKKFSDLLQGEGKGLPIKPEGKHTASIWKEISESPELSESIRSSGVKEAESSVYEQLKGKIPELTREDVRSALQSFDSVSGELFPYGKHAEVAKYKEDYARQVAEDKSTAYMENKGHFTPEKTTDALHRLGAESFEEIQNPTHREIYIPADKVRKYSTSVAEKIKNSALKKASENMKIADPNLGGQARKDFIGDLYTKAETSFEGKTIENINEAIEKLNSVSESLKSEVFHESIPAGLTEGIQQITNKLALSNAEMRGNYNPQTGKFEFDSKGKLKVSRKDVKPLYKNDIVKEIQGFNKKFGNLSFDVQNSPYIRQAFEGIKEALEITLGEGPDRTAYDKANTAYREYKSMDELSKILNSFAEAGISPGVKGNFIKARDAARKLLTKEHYGYLEDYVSAIHGIHTHGASRFVSDKPLSQELIDVTLGVAGSGSSILALAGKSPLGRITAMPKVMARVGSKRLLRRLIGKYRGENYLGEAILPKDKVQPLTRAIRGGESKDSDYFYKKPKSLKKTSSSEGKSKKLRKKSGKRKSFNKTEKE